MIIYIVLSANYGFWVALKIAFEALLEVKGAARVVKETVEWIWNPVS